MGRQGFAGSEAAAGWLFGPAGVVLVLLLAFCPVVTVLTRLGLAAIDPSLEEAGRVVARPGRVLVRLLLPLASPAIALAALIVFSLAFAELGVPSAAERILQLLHRPRSRPSPAPRPVKMSESGGR